VVGAVGGVDEGGVVVVVVVVRLGDAAVAVGVAVALAVLGVVVVVVSATSQIIQVLSLEAVQMYAPTVREW
jgi:hypothetical protein